jgi:hypothetical protein
MYNRIELRLGQESVSETLRRTAAPRVPAGATLVMEKGEVISLRLSGRPFRVACITGQLWVTVDGSAEDHVLIPREARTFRGRGTVVIQALRTATARVDCSL